MKWLLLFPAWVFLLVYLIHRVKEANREVQSLAPREAMAPDLRDPVKRPPRAPVLTASSLGERTGDIRNRVQILPLDPAAATVSPLWTPAELEGPSYALAQRAEFDSWKLHEAESFAFYYPDAAEFRVEESAGPVPPPMVGALFHRSERPAEKWYRIVGPGDSTWCALAVDFATSFDEGVRYPQPEIFNKLTLVPGGVARFSLAADGKVCGVQWLGQGIRITLLDWQHCSAHRDAYLTVASSLELNGSLDESRRRLGEMVADAGLSNRLGLLERGMDEASVHSLLGRPVGIDGDLQIYHVTGATEDVFYRVPILGGRFAGFGAEWRTARKDPPIRGSLEWMREKTEIRVGESGGVGYNLGVLTDEEVEFIFSEIRGRLPNAAPAEWKELSGILASMSEMGLRDVAIQNILRRRIMELGMPMRSAILVLRRWDPEGARGLFIERAKALMAKHMGVNPTGGSEDSSGLADLELLISNAGTRSAEAQELLRVAAEHPHARVREAGFSLWPSMAESSIGGLRRAGLRDASVQVRRYCAEAFAELGAKPEDRDLLAARLVDEKDPQVREHLSEVILRLDANRGAQR